MYDNKKWKNQKNKYFYLKKEDGKNNGKSVQFNKKTVEFIV